MIDKFEYIGPKMDLTISSPSTHLKLSSPFNPTQQNFLAKFSQPSNVPTKTFPTYQNMTSDPTVYDPTKKIKPDHDAKDGLGSVKTSFSQCCQSKTSLGTIQEVFKFPINFTTIGKHYDAEYMNDYLELSCMSSISSDSSDNSNFDFVDEMVEQINHKIREDRNTAITKDSLKDNASTLNTKSINLSSKSNSLLKFGLHSKNCDPNSSNINSKRSFPFDEEQKASSSKLKGGDCINPASKKIDMATISECEDNSDSDLTRSTCLGLESRRLSGNETLANKMLETPFGMGFDIFNEKNARKSEKKRSKSKRRREQQDQQISQKHQAGSALINQRQKSILLNLRTNSSYWKAERKLNKLQRLKNEQEMQKGQEPVEIMNYVDFRSFVKAKNYHKSIEESDSEESSEEIDTPIGEMYQAVIPKFEGNMGKKKRRNLKPVWVPDVIDRRELNKYFNRLFQMIEEPVDDEDKALRVLKDFGMNIATALADVKQNIPSYKENLRLKIKKSRRRVEL